MPNAFSAPSHLWTSVVAPATAHLETVIIGREVIAYDVLPSTNSLLREQALAGAAEGLVALADAQTAGRGRRGRNWVAPPGSSILMSTLLRPTWLVANDVFYLTMLAAVTLAEALQQATGLEVGLKWPNDVQVAGRKLAGILVELELREREHVAWAIVGWGINVNAQPDEASIAQSATSIAEATGQAWDRVPVLRTLLQTFDRQYLALRAGKREALRSAWRERLTTLGAPVQVSLTDRVLEGIAEDVATDGALLLRCADGTLHRVLAGDVRLRHQS